MVHTGMMIGGFEILERIKVGGMGAIFRGRSATGTPRAIKVVHPHLLREDSLRRAFLREAQVLEQLTHPGVVRFFHIGEEQVDSEKVVFIAMEWLEGRTLREVIQANRGAGTGWTDASIQLARQLVAPLAYVHGQSIAHRDIKPENIFLTDDQQLKLIDFGLAFADDENLARMSTQAGIAGTVAYMAPEVLDDIETTEPAARMARGQQADVFAAGICLHELIAGRHPCHELADGDSEEISSAQLMFHMAFSALPRLTECRPDLASPLSDWVDGATSRDPDERFEHGQAMQDSLAAAVEAHIVGATPPPKKPLPQPVQVVQPDPVVVPEPVVVVEPVDEDARPTEFMVDGDVEIELAPDLERQQRDSSVAVPPRTPPALIEEVAEPPAKPSEPPAAARPWKSIEDVQPGAHAFGGSMPPPDPGAEPTSAPTEVAPTPTQVPEASPAPPLRERGVETPTPAKPRKRRVRVVEPPKTTSVAATPAVKAQPVRTPVGAETTGSAGPGRRRGMGRGLVLLIAFFAALWTVWFLVKQGGDILSCGVQPADLDEEGDLNRAANWSSNPDNTVKQDEGHGMAGLAPGDADVQTGQVRVHAGVAQAGEGDIGAEAVGSDSVDLGELVADLGVESGEANVPDQDEPTPGSSDEEFAFEAWDSGDASDTQEAESAEPSLSITISDVADGGYTTVEVDVTPEVGQIDIKAPGREAKLVERNGRWKLYKSNGQQMRKVGSCAIVEALSNGKATTMAHGPDGSVLTFRPLIQVGPMADIACGITD